MWRLIEERAAPYMDSDEPEAEELRKLVIQFSKRGRHLDPKSSKERANAYVVRAKQFLEKLQRLESEAGPSRETVAIAAPKPHDTTEKEKAYDEAIAQMDKEVDDIINTGGQLFQKEDFDERWREELSDNVYKEFVEYWSSQTVPSSWMGKEFVRELEAEGSSWPRYYLSRAVVNW